MSKSIYQHKLTNQILAMIPARQVVQKVYDAVHSYRHSMMTLVKTFFLSIAAQLASVAFFVVVGSALNFNIPLAAYFFAVPVGFIVSSVPLAPAGIGVGQVAFLFLFKIYIGPEQASIGPTGVTVYQAVLLLWSLIGAYFYAQRNRPVLEEVSS